MQIQIESTDQLTEMGGVSCRIWAGTTATGTPCFAFVFLIVERNDQDKGAFDAELAEQLPPGRIVPLGMVLRST
jgi:hypothetical protein